MLIAFCSVCGNWGLIIFVVLLSRFLIWAFMMLSHWQLKKFVEQDVPIEEDDEIRKKQKESIWHTKLVALRDKKLWWVTFLAGLVEVCVLAGVLVFLMSNTLSNIDIAKYFMVFLGGWLGIKILSNHGPWSDYLVGKAYYHISLIGTLLNVVSAILIAFLYANKSCW